jgi:small subunit ribosomal protein S20
VPRIKSAKKRLRQSIVRKARNKPVKSRLKTEIKKARIEIAEKHVETAASQVRLASSLLDKAATKGVIHKRQAARRKSRIALAANKAAAGATEA